MSEGLPDAVGEKFCSEAVEAGEGEGEREEKRDCEASADAVTVPLVLEDAVVEALGHCEMDSVGDSV